MKEPRPIEEIRADIEKANKKMTKALNDEKRLLNDAKVLTRKERTRRLCTRAGMLESFLINPLSLSDEQVYELIKMAFSSQEVRDKNRQMIDENYGET